MNNYQNEMFDPVDFVDSLPFLTTAGYYFPANRFIYTNLDFDITDIEERPVSVETTLFEHEVLHHVQTQTTSIGYILQLIENCKTLLVVALCKNLRDQNIKELKTPLTRWYRFGDEDNLSLKKFSWSYSRLSHFGDLVCGDCNENTDEMYFTLKAIKRIKTEYQNVNPVFQHLNLIPDFDLHNTNMACPIAMKSLEEPGETQPIGARAMLESWAHLMEMFMLRASTDWDNFEQLLNERAYGPYRIVWGALQNSLTQMKDRPFVDFVLTGIALCELALSPNLMGTIKWEDFHPGHRFATALHTVEHNSIKAIDARLFPKDYIRFIQELCKALKWPTPWVTAKSASKEIEKFNKKYKAASLFDQVKGLRFRSQNRVSSIVHPLVFFGVENKTIRGWKKMNTDDLLVMTNGSIYSYGKNIQTLLLNHFTYIYSRILAESQKPFDDFYIIQKSIGKWIESDQVKIGQAMDLLHQLYMLAFSNYPPESCTSLVMSNEKGKWTRFECVVCHETFTYKPSIIMEKQIREIESEIGESSQIVTKCPHCPTRLLLNRVNGKVSAISKEEVEQLTSKATSNKVNFVSDFSPTGKVDIEVEKLNIEGQMLLDIHNDVSGALKKFEQGIKLQKHHPQCWYHLGLCLAKQNRLDSAVEAFRHAVRFDESLLMAWNNLGTALAMLGRLEEATSSFDEGIKIDPKYPKFYLGKGNIYMMKGDFVSARQCLELALKYDPSYQKAREALQMVESMQRKK